MEVNQKVLRQLETDVGAQMMPQILSRFRAEVEQRAQALRPLIDIADHEQIGKQAHALKSVSRTVGLDAVADLAAAVEAAAREGNAQSAISQASELIALCEQGIECLDAHAGEPGSDNLP